MEWPRPRLPLGPVHRLTLPVPSPCTGVCRIADGICAGCARTLDEIARWGSASEVERRAILAAIAIRQRPQTPLAKLEAQRG
ncbi:MAG TPA: DUF1289 domain-containing protein [Sphingomonas sp.]